MWKCPPHHVLVPVDFGEASGRAIEVGGAIAARLSSTLRLLHAEQLEAPPYFTHEQIAALEHQRRAARDRAATFLLDFGRQHRAPKAEAAIVDGEAVATIVAAAKNADLVVMGTHGRRGPTRWLMGSVAERVVHESPSPVLVVRADGRSTAPEQVFSAPLVVALPAAEGETTRVAEGLAHAFGGQVAARAIACQADLAHRTDASVIVISKPLGEGGMFDHPVEQWLRSCTLPMLFVPTLVPAGTAA